MKILVSALISVLVLFSLNGCVKKESYQEWRINQQKIESWNKASCHCMLLLSHKLCTESQREELEGYKLELIKMGNELKNVYPSCWNMDWDNKILNLLYKERVDITQILDY